MLGSAFCTAVLASCSIDHTPAGAPPEPTTTAKIEVRDLGPTGGQAVTAHPEHEDPRWRFFTADKARHTSPWFAGRHRVMIGYGCTVAPYYTHDDRCPDRQGFHHGIDIAMPCGTRLVSDVTGRVVDPRSSGAPGPAYGPDAFRIRSHGLDFLIGHVRRVYVRPGEAVRRGQLVARANDQGAPDGCHLHFEVRRAGGGLTETIDPARYLRLSG